MRIALSLVVTLAITPAKPYAKPSKIKIECPPFIQTTQQTKTQAEGWSVGGRTDQNNLIAVEFFDGQPSKLFSINGEPAGTAKKPLMRWSLPKDKSIWVSCSYSDTALTMDRQLPPGVTRCEMSHSPESRYIILSVICD